MTAPGRAGRCLVGISMFIQYAVLKGFVSIHREQKGVFFEKMRMRGYYPSHLKVKARAQTPASKAAFKQCREYVRPLNYVTVRHSSILTLGSVTMLHAIHPVTSKT
jgi:hypothetical protein